MAMPYNQRLSADPPGEIPLAAVGPHERRMPAIIRSEELLQGQVEVLIEHGDETYRLRRTRSGKLILQK